MKKIYIFILLSIIILGLFFLYQESKEGFSTKSQKITIRLKWKHQAQFAGLYTSKEKGYFKDAYLDVELLERDPKVGSVSDEVADQKVDFGIVSIFEFLDALNEGKDIIALASFYQRSPSAIVSLGEENILSVKDLKGKTIGIGNDKWGKFLTQTLLKKEGMNDEDVKFKEVGFNQISELMNHSVDAVALYRTNELYLLKKKNIPYNIILPEDHNIFIYNDILITSGQYYIKNQRTVEKFTRMTMKGWNYAMDNKEEALLATLKYTGENEEDIAYQKFILNESEPLMRPASEKRIGYMSAIQWDHIYNLVRDNGLIGDFDIFSKLAPVNFSIHGK